MSAGRGHHPVAQHAHLVPMAMLERLRRELTVYSGDQRLVVDRQQARPEKGGWLALCPHCVVCPALCPTN